MIARLPFCIVAALVSNWLLGQVAIDPIWSRLLPSSYHVTRLAFDHGTDRLHIAFQPAPTDLHTHIRAFNSDGTDIPPPYSELTLGTFLPATVTTGYPYTSDEPLRLLAQDDTLYFVDHFEQQVDYLSWYRSGSITLDSATTFSMHTGWDAQVDFHHDPLGDITVSPTVIRNFSKHHWLLGRAIVPTTDRIAADETRIYCGRVPSIAVLDRDQMSMLAPIAVPSGGTSTRTLLMLADEVIHYASVNSNLTLDIGAVDTTGSVIWNILLSLSQPTTLSGITTDALGNFWVACSQSGAFPTGVLYRFSAAGTQTGNYLCGRTIDDIVCSGDQVFLSGWDAVDQAMVYLAAFDTDITTSTPFPGSSGSTVSPNPANEVLYVHGNTTWTEGWVADATGKTVVSIPQAELSSGSISISNLAAGIYRLSVRNGKDAAQLPFMIAR